MNLTNKATALHKLAVIAAGILAAGGALLVSERAQAADTSVSIIDFGFVPSNITVSVGDTVTWTNTGAVAHTVTSDTGGTLTSGNLSNGQTYVITFSTAGVVSYHCSIHPSMIGVVTVQASATNTPTATATATTPTSTGTATATVTSTATSAPTSTATATATPRPPSSTPTSAATSAVPAPPGTGTTPPDQGTSMSVTLILLLVAGLGAAGSSAAIALKLRI